MAKTTTPSTPLYGVARTLLALLGGLLVAGALQAQVVWTGTDLSNNSIPNWSDSTNWTGGIPGPAANILFNDVGDANPNNNTVDTNLTVLSLWYASTNINYTTTINPGVTLTVSNNAAGNLLVVGTLTDSGSVTVDATITDGGLGGELVVVSTNVGSGIQIQQGSTNAGSHLATLDLSTLGTFNLTAGRLSVAANSLSGVSASNHLSGALNLALTNVIHLNGATAPALDIGDDVQNVNNGTPMLQLGETNELFVDTMTVGRYKTPGTLQFNSGIVDGNEGLYLRGQTAARVSTLAIGDNLNAGTSSTTTGLMDLSVGTVDAQVDACYVARGQISTATGGSAGTLNLNAGIFNVNTLNVGAVSTSNANYNVTGTVNVNNTATLVVNSSLALGSNPNISTTNATLSTATANLFIGANGNNTCTVYANTITSTAALANGVNSTIDVENGATLYLTNTMGTPAQPIGTLNLYGGDSLHLNASPVATNIVATSVSGDGNGDAVITIDSIVGYIGGTNTYPLITYTDGDEAQDGNDPFPSFSLGSLPSGFGGTLVDNYAANEIDLQITNGIIEPDLGSVLWGGGVNNHWDTTSLNWTNGALTTWYGDTDLVTFNDLAQTNKVSLAVTVSPGSVTVSNSVLNYTISGAGAIAGSGGLTKWGAGTLTLGTTNTYTGGTAINGGTLITAVPGALLPASAVFFTNATAAFLGTNTLNLQGWSQTLGNLITTNNTVVTNNIIITGAIGSALTVSPATLTLASFMDTNFLTVNLFGLSFFTYNNSAGTFQASVGVATVPNNVGATGNGIQTTVTLAGGSNSITAANLDVGTFSSNANTPITQLNLGTNNTWNVGAINLGGGRTGDSVQFASGVTGGTLKIAGVAGGSSLATFTTASHDSYQAIDKPVDLFDTTAGTLNAQFGALTVGKAGPTTLTENRGVSFTSSFKMGAGTLNASSLLLGVIPNATQTNATFYYTWTNTALFSLTNGGLASITNIIVASNSYVGNMSTGSVLSATVSLTNGATLNATTIQGGAIATPALGTLNVTAQILWGDGTLGNIPGAGLTVSNVSVVLAGAGTNHNVNITSGQNGLISSVISGPGTLTDIGAGPLTLTGTNAFNGLILAGTSTLTLAAPSTNAGTLMVNGGTLLVNAPTTIVGIVTNNGGTLLVNAHLTASALTVQNNGFLGGSNTLLAPVTVQAGGTIQGGSAGYTGALTTEGLTLGSGSTDTTYSRFTVAAQGEVKPFTLSVNGTHIVQILDSSLAIGTNTLFTGFNSIGGTSGTNGFQLQILGTLPAGTTAQLLFPTNKFVVLAVSASSTLIPTLRPGITNFSLVGGTNVVIKGTNGQAGYTYYLLTTTNLAYPVTQWRTVATNVLGTANYTFIGTNAAGKLTRQFFRLSSTNYNPISPY